MSERSLFEPGSPVRMRFPVLKSLEERPDARLGEIKAILPEGRWRAAETPEYRVACAAIPIQLIVRHDDLELITDSQSEGL